MDRRKMVGALGGLGTALTAGASDQKPGHSTAAGGPLNGPHAHFCGIHMAKSNPKLQFLTHHLCAAHKAHGKDDMFQCVLFDSMEPNARLIGVEYLISDDAYRALPEGEKKFWHAHTYEVLGGGLTAPGMDSEEEMKFMKAVINMWGKAWHTWPDWSTPVPMGEPMLIWSLMGDGQADPKLVAERDRKFNISEKQVRAKRAKAFGLQAPKVSLPKNLDTIGRQWTDEGEDKPTPIK